jgi:dihydroorotate dehydrogenase (fumarate)
VIGSLNGATPGGWVKIAKEMESAGADAIELNLYSIPTDVDRTADQVEDSYIEVVKAVRKDIKIPLAVKISPYYSNLSHFAKRLEKAGVNGLVLFNRFYQPDIDIERLEVRSDVFLSSPQTLRLPLRWIGLLYKRVHCDFAATGGIQGSADVLKMLMVGANVTMLCAILLRKGIDHIRVIEKDLLAWMKEHEYHSVSQMQGSMSQIHSDNPSAFERAQYIKALKTFRPDSEK